MTAENNNTELAISIGEYPTINFNGELLIQTQEPYVSGTFDDAGILFRALAVNAEGDEYELVRHFYDCDDAIYRADYGNLPWEDATYLTVTKL